MKCRKIKDSEYDELRSVWCEVFGEDPIFVDELYYAMKATGYVCEDNDTLHAFLTLLNVGEINGQKVQVSYAICTRPESRGKGYASELVKYVRDMVTGKGNISLICPADGPLILFYGRLGYDPEIFAADLTATANELPLKVKMIDAAKYRKYREAFLADVPHVKLNNKFAKFIKNDSVNAQGMLLINGGDAICTIDYGTDEEMGLSELIINPALLSVSSEIAEQIAGGLANLFEVERTHYRMPTYIVYTDESGDHYSDGSYPQGMIAGNTESLDTARMLPYFGFPMD